MEEYADTVDLAIGKAEQVFYCPGSGSRVPYNTEVCDFIARERANVTAIAAENVGKFSTLLSSSCTSVADCMRQCEDLVRPSSQ